MGWIDGTHEGFLEGLCRDPRCGAFVPGSDERMRALGDAVLDRDPTPVSLLRIGCCCGWRSQVLHAPMTSEWIPNAVFVPAWFKERCLYVWTAHVRASAFGDQPAEISYLIDALRNGRQG